MTHWSAIVSVSALCVVTTGVVLQGQVNPQLVAAINTNIGDLDRSTREILLLGDRRHKAIDKIEAANEAALRLLLQVTDDILSRIGVSVDRARNGQTEAPDLQRDLASLRAAYASRADFNRVTTLLSGIGWEVAGILPRLGSDSWFVSEVTDFGEPRGPLVRVRRRVSGGRSPPRPDQACGRDWPGTEPCGGRSDKERR